MSCLPCSKVSAQEQDLVKYHKKLYKDTGIVYWAYRLSSKDTFQFVKNQYFRKIREEQIEPNFTNGAEYFHIEEFKG